MTFDQVNYLNAGLMLLAAGVAKDAKDDLGRTALFIAACYDFVPCVKTLVAHGAEGADEAAEAARAEGHTDCVNLLRSS